jgi:hypothetical protein
MKKALIFILPLVSLILNLGFSRPSWAETLLGTVRHKGQIIYLEQHQIFSEQGNPSIIKKIETKYTDQQKEVGYRQQEFSPGHYIPNLVFKDKISDETYSITVNNQRAILQTLFNKTEKKTKFKITKDMVTTSSISKYIFENFNSLLKKSSTIKCLMPRSHRFVKLNIKNYKETDSQVTFVIRPASIFLRYLADKTYVTLDKKTKYWIEYKGFSNLKSKKGKVLDVKIDYVVSQSKL